MNDAAFPVAADSRGALTQLDQLAAIPEEEIWLAKQKKPANPSDWRSAGPQSLPSKQPAWRLSCPPLECPAR